MKKNIFITATDTDVGKTIVTLCLGTLLKEKGVDVGVFKPVQCAGDDSAFLKKHLSLEDPLNKINPCFSPEPLSPNIAFSRQKTPVNIPKIKKSYHELSAKYDMLLVEGAGGLMVPLKNNYFVGDLIRDLNCELVIVSRLGLGAINHTILTIQQARRMGLNVLGVIFNQKDTKQQGIPEQTNPDVIRSCGQVNIIGSVPYLKSFQRKYILSRCADCLKLKPFVTAKKPNQTSRLRDWDQQYIWHPFTQMQDWLKDEPLIIDQAKGSYLVDTDGNRYLDGVSSLWVNVHGHGQKTIDAAIKGQIDRLSHSTLLGLSSTPAIELAQKLVQITPKGLDKVFYSDNGSTSVEIAIKIAYQYWQNIGQKKKNTIAHLSNAYHGDTLGSVSVGGIDLFHRVYRQLTFKTIQIDFPDCYRAPKGKKYPSYAFECLENFEQILKKNHHKIAAFIVEPIVQGAAGMIIWPKGVLKRMWELCRQYNVVFITDEVATGFGRTGKMFACNQEGVRPDIMCLAKGITGGYLPLAATLTSNKLYDGFLFGYKDQKAFFHGHTYTGNPLCCAAALANLKVFEEQQVLKKLAVKIKYLRKHLQMFYNLESVGDVRQSGFMVGIELIKNQANKEPFAWEDKVGIKVCQEVRKEGVILRPLGNVIVMMPPLSMSERELKKMIDVTYAAIEKITL